MSATAEHTARWIDYDYAIVRVVPRVHLSCFFNIGVVLHARTVGFLDVRIEVDRELLPARCPDLDLDLLDRFIEAYRLVCVGGPAGGPIGMLPPSERFHWLTAPRSAVIQTSAVHPGRGHDVGEALELLFREQVVGA